MLPLLLALAAPALASDIVVTLDRPVMVFVDGMRLPMDVGSLSAQARGLGSGTHQVEVRTMLNQPVTGMTVDLAADEELRLSYQRRALVVLGRGGLPSAASAPAAPAAPASTGFTAVTAPAAPASTGFTAVTATAAAPAAPTTETATVTATTPAGGISLSVSVTEGAAPAAPPAPANAWTSSASFAGLDPVMFAITLDGQPVTFVPTAGAFVAPELSPGKHAFRMTLGGAEALRADFTTEPGVHSACTILVQPMGYDTACVPGGPPLTRAALQQGAAASVGAAGIQIQVSTGGTALAVPAVPAAPVGPQPMAEPALAALVATVADASFGSDQVGILRTAAAGNHFTCAQVVRLLEPMSFGSDKLEAMRALRPAILDPQNAFQLESAFTFSTEKEEVRAMFR